MQIISPLKSFIIINGGEGTKTVFILLMMNELALSIIYENVTLLSDALV